MVIGPGDGVVFDWEPTLTSAAELMTAPRGTDPRLDALNRPTTSQRRQTYYERMDAKAEARAELDREREAGIWREDHAGHDDATATPTTASDEADGTRSAAEDDS